MRARHFPLHIFIVTVIAMSLPLTVARPALAARVKTIKVTDASVIEGDGGSKSMSFTVSWSGSKGGGGVSVSYATTDVTAVAGSDYTAKSGTVGLSNGGCRCSTVSIAILGDNTFEGTETLQLNLSNPVNGVIGDAQGVGTIYDNEGPPTLIAGDAASDESAASLVMTVVLTSTVPGGTTVDYATADGSATAGSDYTTKSGTLAFSSSQTTKTISVPIADDVLSEDDETFALNLSNATGASITDVQGLATINDDDVDPDISVADATLTEGDSGTSTASFTVGLSTAAGREVLVDYATTDLSGFAGTDYTPSNGTLSFPAGQTTTSIDVPVIGDAIHEGDETFSLTLSAPVNGTIADAAALGTITDDDPEPSLSVGDVLVEEGNAGTTTASFTVSVVGQSAFPATVGWSTVAGTATPGVDFEAGSGLLSVEPGIASATIEVTIDGDAVDEPDEVLNVVLAGPSGASIGDGTGEGTIQDDDKTPTLLAERVRKTSRSVMAKGTIEPAVAGMKISVTLSKKRGAKFVKVAKKTVTVKALGDKDGDSLPDAAFAASFKRPSRGSYLFIAKYLGGPDLLPSSRKVKFKV